MDISDLLKSILDELQTQMTSKTVVGEMIQANDHTIIPVSKINFGFFGGGGHHSSDSNAGQEKGQGVGGGWQINPVAFVIIGPDGAKLHTIGQDEHAITKLLDLAPKVVETVKDMVDKKKKNPENHDEPETNQTEENEL